MLSNLKLKNTFSLFRYSGHSLSMALSAGPVTSLEIPPATASRCQRRRLAHSSPVGLRCSAAMEEIILGHFLRSLLRCWRKGAFRLNLQIPILY